MSFDLQKRENGTIGLIEANVASSVCPAEALLAKKKEMVQSRTSTAVELRFSLTLP